MRLFTAFIFLQDLFANSRGRLKIYQQSKWPAKIKDTSQGGIFTACLPHLHRIHISLHYVHFLQYVAIKVVIG